MKNEHAFRHAKPKSSSAALSSYQMFCFALCEVYLNIVSENLTLAIPQHLICIGAYNFLESMQFDKRGTSLIVRQNI